MIMLDHVIFIFLTEVSTLLFIYTTVCVSAEFHIMEAVGCVTCDDWESTVHGNPSDDMYTA